ncbi:hypothetical protein KJ359_010198 [Pestalotiopsis sp. 9143b]|nr:hypothetical protein KJ359_010198 [Pestalotiopsis sp. 9143b]
MEFMLLDLLPGQNGQEIVCQTRTARLDQNTPYEAVSYVWMEASGRRDIQVSGEKVGVTNNLHAALQHLRDAEHTRTLWIDQLCIDQWDVEKKAKQVDMMRLIYRQCSRCLIWLGEIPQDGEFNSDDVATVFAFIQLSACSSDNSKGLQELVARLLTPNATRRAQAALIALSIKGNPWWSRIWTVQESVLPKEAQLIWGSQKIEWVDVQRAARNFCQSLWHLPEPLTTKFVDWLDNLVSPVRGLELATGGDSPLNILERWRYRGATDPRDKIFALMGLFSEPPFPSLIHCDYDLSAATVYTKVTVDLLGIERGLRPLIGIRDSINTSLPSWVTDFERVPNIETSERWWNHAHRYVRYNADNVSVFEYRYLPPLGALELTGIRVDGVGEVSQKMLKAYDHAEVKEDDLIGVIRSWSRETSWNSPKFDEAYDNDSSRSHAFGATLIGDFLMAEFPTRGARPEEYEMVFQYATNGTKITSRALYHSLRTFIINQRFFVTTEGYLGMGPQMMGPGDEVWILFGGSVPFILRPTNTSSSEIERKYTLVGQAYVHGIMYGEVVRARRDDQRLIRLY